MCSVEGIEHVEEEDAEKPNGDEDVVGGDGHVLRVLLDFGDEGHRVEDEHADERDPCENCVVDAVVQEVYTE